jgi:hypothetical protein
MSTPRHSLPIERLTAEADMSASAFHQRFRSVAQMAMGRLRAKVNT